MKLTKMDMTDYNVQLEKQFKLYLTTQSHCLITSVVSIVGIIRIVIVTVVDTANFNSNNNNDGHNEKSISYNASNIATQSQVAMSTGFISITSRFSIPCLYKYRFMQAISIGSLLTMVAKMIAGIVQKSECHVPQRKQRIVSTIDSVKKWSPTGRIVVVAIIGVGCELTTTTLLLT